MNNQDQNTTTNTLGGRLPERIETCYVYDSVESYISAMCILFTHDPTIKFDFSAIPNITRDLVTSVNLDEKYCNRILLADIIYSYPDHKERDAVWRGVYYDNKTWAIQREIYPDIHASEHTTVKKTYNGELPNVCVPCFLMSTIDFREHNPVYLEAPALIRVINAYYRDYCLNGTPMPYEHMIVYRNFEKLTHKYPPYTQEVIDLLTIKNIDELNSAIEGMLQYE